MTSIQTYFESLMGYLSSLKNSLTSPISEQSSPKSQLILNSNDQNQDSNNIIIPSRTLDVVSPKVALSPSSPLSVVSTNSDTLKEMSPSPELPFQNNIEYIRNPAYPSYNHEENNDGFDNGDIDTKIAIIKRKLRKIDRIKTIMRRNSKSVTSEQRALLAQEFILKQQLHELQQQNLLNESVAGLRHAIDRERQLSSISSPLSTKDNNNELSSPMSESPISPASNTSTNQQCSTIDEENDADNDENDEDDENDENISVNNIQINQSIEQNQILYTNKQQNQLDLRNDQILGTILESTNEWGDEDGGLNEDQNMNDKKVFDKQKDEMEEDDQEEQEELGQIKKESKNEKKEKQQQQIRYNIKSKFTLNNYSYNDPFPSKNKLQNIMEEDENDENDNDGINTFNKQQSTEYVTDEENYDSDDSVVIKKEVITESD